MFGATKRVCFFAGMLAAARLGVPLLAAFWLATTFLGVAIADEGGDTAKPLVFGSEIGYPPFCIVDESGAADGFSVELARAASAVMGREAEFRTDKWAEVKGWLVRGEVDALPLVGRTPEREEFFDFTFPYITMHGSIVVRQNTDNIQDISDLRGRRVAVMANDNAEEFLRREDRGVEIIATPTFEESLRLLAAGGCDAVLVQRLVALRLIKEIGLADELKIIKRPVKDFRQDFCMAVNKGDSKTLAVLNEGLSIAIADGTYRRLHAKWFAALELPTERRLVFGGDHNLPPFEYLDDDGRPAGHNVELVKAIGREMDMEVEIRLGPWEEIITALENGEIDVVCAMYSQERDERFDFSTPFAAIHYVAVVRAGSGEPPGTVEKLAGKRLVIQAGDVMEGWIPIENVQIATTENMKDALKELAAGKHDCAIVPRAVALNDIRRYNLEGLVVGKRPFLSMEYCFMTRTGQKALLANFDEGLKALEHSGELRRVHNKWLGMQDDGHQTLLRIIKIIGGVIGLLIVGLAAMASWSWSLRHQVAARTRELRASEGRLAATLQSIGDGVVSCDTNGRVVELNAAAAALTGWDAGEAAGQLIGEVFKIVQAHTREPVDNPVWQSLRDGKVVALANHTVLISRDGGERHIADSCAPIRHGGGAPVGAVLVFRDVTESYHQREQLRESEERFKQLAKLSRTVVWEMDADGLYTHVSDTAAEVFGYEPDELVGRKYFHDIHPEEGRGQFKDENLAMMRRQERIANYENRVLTKGGEVIWVLSTGVPVLDADGRHAGYRGGDTDITARKRGEEELVDKNAELERQTALAREMAAKAEAAASVKSQFLANMSHELRTPLNGVIAPADMLLELDPSNEQRELAEIISSSGRHLLQLVNDILDFSKIEAGKLRIQKIPCSISEITTEMLVSLAMKAKQKGLEFSIQFDQRLPEQSMADPLRVGQILMNLVGNAVKFTESGRVDIAVALVERRGGMAAVKFTVADTGIGISAEGVDSLFAPFNQADNSDTRKFGGTGLGLSISKRLVELMGGEIGVDSAPGKGSTFWFSMPIADIAAAGVDDGSHDEHTHEGLDTVLAAARVLVVEDNPVNLKVAVAVLRNIGVTQISTAEDGAKALELLAAEPFDLVLMDCRMPVMDGYEATRAIRDPNSSVLDHQVPIVAMTANAMPEDRRKCLDAGMDEYLAKPVSAQHLRVAVDGAFSKRPRPLRSWVAAVDPQGGGRAATPGHEQ